MPEFESIETDLCLEFHNTATWPEDGDPKETLSSSQDFEVWARSAEIGDDPGAGVRLAEVLSLRRLVHSVFSPLSRWHAPPGSEIQRLNAQLGRALARLTIVPQPRRFRLEFSAGALHPALAAITWSAARLLSSPDLRLLKTCSDAECGKLFLDRSRRNNRRWCDMAVCGNRAKARRLAARRRTG